MSEEEKRVAADKVDRILEEAGFVDGEYPDGPDEDRDVTVTFIVAPLRRFRTWESALTPP